MSSSKRHSASAQSTQSPGVHSLWVRLAVLMLLTSLLLVLLLFVFYHQTESRFYKELTRQTTDLSKAIQIGLEGSAGSQDDPMNLEIYLEELNPKGIQEVSVINSNDRIVASTNHDKVGKLITAQRKELIFRADSGEPVTGEGQLFNVIVPVAAEASPAGYIHLTLNTEDFSVLLRLSAIRRALAAFCLLSLGTLVAVILARYHTRPIADLALAAESVAAGNFDQALPTERRDEIGLLARSFDGMISRLREDHSLRERLRTAEHLASAGQFARHIAHEIKNPLNFINLSIDHIADTYRPKSVEEAEPFDILVRHIKNEITRISHFSESFLEYGRPFELRLRRCEIDSLLGDVLALAAAQARDAQIRIVRETAPLPALQVDADFLRTGLYNIVKNAFEAMPSGGTLTVRSRMDDAFLTLIFTDTGKGVAKEHRDMLFTPFFSTKPGGLGLGLALTRRVIEEHGGTVQVESSPSHGSTVLLSLPLGGSAR